MPWQADWLILLHIYSVYEMDFIQFVAKAKARKAVIIIGMVGAILAFVTDFGDNIKKICTWISLCGPDAPVSPLAQIALGQGRSYVEQPSLLGLPKYNRAQSINPELDAQFELESDERELGSEMLEAVEANKYADAAQYYNAKYEFATYSKDEVNYIVRYRKASQEVSAILLESVDGLTKCTTADLRKMHGLQMVFAHDKPLCIAKLTFGELFPNGGGSIRTPTPASSAPATCWGGLSSGGAAGRSSGVEITCHFTRESLASPDLNYLVKIGSSATEFTDVNYSFDERANSREGTFRDFVSKASKYRAQFVIIFDPAQPK